MNSQKNLFWEGPTWAESHPTPLLGGMGPFGPQEQFPSTKAEAPSALRASLRIGLIAQLGQLIRGRPKDTDFFPSPPFSLDDFHP